MKFASLEDRGGGPENEVGIPPDIAALEILAVPVAVNGIVRPQKLAVHEDGFVGVDVNGQGRVVGGGGGILEGQVVGVKTGCVDIGAGGTARAPSHPRGRIDALCVTVVGEGDSCLALAQEGDVGLVAGQRQRFLVGSVLDVDDRAGRAVGGHGVQGRLDGGEISGPVLGHDEIIAGGGLGPRLGHRQEQESHGQYSGQWFF